MHRIKKFLNDPAYGIIKRVRPIIGDKYIPDRPYLQWLFHYVFGYRLDLKHPTTFNEKLNWLKLYDRNPLYTQLVDKYEVKQWVANKIGSEYVIPTLGVYESVSDIAFDDLPNQFVLKCTHDSGSTIVCKDKESFNFSEARQKLAHSLELNHFLELREWPYKNCRRRIIAEQYVDDENSDALQDYKWWCFGGVPKYMYFSVKTDSIYENFYDMDFNPVYFNHGFLRHSPEFQKPAAFEEMKRLSEELSSNIPFVRCDFYFVKGRVFFGELTFYDWGGMQPFNAQEDDVFLGELIKLPHKNRQ